MAELGILEAMNQARVVQAETEQAKRGLGQEEFLKLLVAQLENQDPLNPQDSTEFTAQLAQFSSLEQQISIRTNLEKLLEAQQERDAVEQSLQVAGLIGKEVRAVGDQVEVVESGQPVPIHFGLESFAKVVAVAIRDENGVIVRRLEAAEMTEGANSVVWDGLDLVGAPAPPGVYTFEVAAATGNEFIASEPVMIGRVTGASFGSETPVLRLGGRVLAFDNVFEVNQGEDDTPAGSGSGS